MTLEDLNKINPGKTILNVKTDDGYKKVLIMFFIYNPENFNGYWLGCTDDLSNLCPNEVTDDVLDGDANNAAIMSYNGYTHGYLIHLPNE